MTLPAYFYDINHPIRWVDGFTALNGEQRIVLSPLEIKRKVERNTLYKEWLKRFRFKDQPLRGKQMTWQVVQILKRDHSENSHLDWWPDYLDCLFRVFVQPETRYCKLTKEHKQWYLLAPKESELVLHHELTKKGVSLPAYSPLQSPISRDKRLRKALLVPVECCRHFRHETTAGKLPEGL